MTSAGRILIMPKGNYDASVTYEMLDLVFHGGASWVAKKTATGIEPSLANAEHWMLMCSGTDITTLEQRMSALEASFVNLANEEEEVLSEYAKKSAVDALSTKLLLMESEVGSLGETVGGLEETVGDLGETVSGLSSTLAGLVANGSQQAGKFAIASYKGDGGKPGINKFVSVTFDFAPKVIIMLGWTITSYPYGGTEKYISQIGANHGTAHYRQTVIFCDFITTEMTNDAGFTNWYDISQPTRYAKKSADGKTIYWAGSEGEAYNYYNASGYEYYVLGIA